jgi:DNA-binding NarL/FixJ family response regulator
VTSVFVVAAAPALRAGLRAMLQGVGARVVGEGATLPAGSELGLLVVAGLLEEDLAGLEELGRPTVLLTDDSRQALMLQRFALPGWAVLPAAAEAGQLLAAVDAVGQGLMALPAEMAAGLLARPALEVSDPLQEPLTPRELEVLQLVSHGLSNKLIARQLGISEHTVKFHVSSTYAKLGAASRTEAVSLAARKGLISL